jgi:hypothetical protein
LTKLRVKNGPNKRRSPAQTRIAFSS